MRTALGASSAFTPCRASLYARTPPTLLALYCGGTCSISPIKAGSAAQTASCEGTGRPLCSVSPVQSKVSVSVPKRNTARYTFCLSNK